MTFAKRGLACLLAVVALISVNTALAEWQTPCTTAPYDYQFQDDARYITVNRVARDGVTYFVADVQLAQATGFHTALSSGASSGGLESVSAMASRAGAVLAINGDDYGTHNYGVIIRNGELLRAEQTTRSQMAVDRNGDMTVRSERNGEDAAALGQQLVSEGVLQTFEFGPELVLDGKTAEFGTTFDIISTNPSRKEPRTAIGQIGPLHYVLLVVDGRQDGYSVGISLQDLQSLFLQYGAKTAMNLDGGGSTEMWFQGQVINRPSGGVERDVSDAIYF